jgi:hypothetical protein
MKITDLEKRMNEMKVKEQSITLELDNINRGIDNLLEHRNLYKDLND